MAHADYETGSGDDVDLIQAYERTGVGLDVSFPHCGVPGKHFGPWSPWYTLHMVCCVPICND
jgi:hypothetical protein